MTRSLFVIALPLYVGPEQAGFLCTGKGFESLTENELSDFSGL
ncbi:hypothetical protein [Asaia lannensis]